MLSASGRARAESLLNLAPLYAPLIGSAVRLAYVLAYSFPLGDGGLFYVMTQELRQAGYALPAHTAYNGAGLPFAYPPLGFYLAGILADVGPWALLDVFRFLPLVLNAATIVAFYPLSRAVLSSKHASDYAITVFALLPHSYLWQIMAGGVARAPGFLFAVLALWQGYLLYSRRVSSHIWPTMVLAACAVLSHPSMGLFVAYSLALFLLCFGRNRLGLTHSLLVAAGTAALTAPWWGTVIARHGASTILTATGTSLPLRVGLSRLAFVDLTDEPIFPLLCGLALLGVLASLKERQFFLLAWLAMAFILDPRMAPTVATIPLAMLAGSGISRVLLPFLNNTSGSAVRRGGPSGVPANVLSVAVLLFFLEYATLPAFTSQRMPLSALGPDARQAMEWIAKHTPHESTFLVISPKEEGVDWTSEWFPALTGRTSATTYQGYEWLGATVFLRQWHRHQYAQRCATGSTDCLQALERVLGIRFDHIYVAKVLPAGALADATASLRCALTGDPGYRLIYESPAAAIYTVRRIGSSPPTSSDAPAPRVVLACYTARQPGRLWQTGFGSGARASVLASSPVAAPGDGAGAALSCGRVRVTWHWRSG